MLDDLFAEQFLQAGDELGLVLVALGDEAADNEFEGADLLAADLVVGAGERDGEGEVGGAVGDGFEPRQEAQSGDDGVALFVAGRVGGEAAGAAHALAQRRVEHGQFGLVHADLGGHRVAAHLALGVGIALGERVQRFGGIDRLAGQERSKFDERRLHQRQHVRQTNHGNPLNSTAILAEQERGGANGAWAAMRGEKPRFSPYASPFAGTMATDSPQPQASVWFGLLKTKRAESLSVT